MPKTEKDIDLQKLEQRIQTYDVSANTAKKGESGIQDVIDNTGIQGVEMGHGKCTSCIPPLHVVDITSFWLFLFLFLLFNIVYWRRLY